MNKIIDFKILNIFVELHRVMRGGGGQVGMFVPDAVGIRALLSLRKIKMS